MRVFSNGPNNMRSSSDHISRKRAKTTYSVVSSNIKTTQQHNNNSNVPVKTSHNGSLTSVGGFDVKSYDLLLDITKGKYYNANDGRNITLLSTNTTQQPNALVNINDCSATNIKIIQSSNLQAPISQTWGINEGPFLMDTSFALLYKDIVDLSNSCSCDRPLISNNPMITINNK